LNLEYFIAKRLIRGGTDKISISAPIIKIAIAAIALGILMMLIAIATGNGLKVKIREKVTAFNGHIQIYNYDNNNSDVSVVPVSLEQDFYPEFDIVDEVAHVQAVASKAGVIRTENTFEGMIAKGVGKDFNWKVLEEYFRGISGRRAVARLQWSIKRPSSHVANYGESPATKNGRYILCCFF